MARIYDHYTVILRHVGLLQSRLQLHCLYKFDKVLESRIQLGCLMHQKVENRERELIRI